MMNRMARCLKIILPLMLVLSMLAPLTALATVHAHPSTQSTPTSQCLESLVLLFQGRFTEAKPLQEKALAALQQTANTDPGGLGMCAIFLAIVHQSTGDWVEALATYTVALEAFQADEDPQMTWAAHFGMGSVYAAQGRFAEAYKTLQQTLPLTGRAAGASEKACEDLSIGKNIVAQAWTTENLKPLARAVTLNNIGLVLAVPDSQDQSSVGDYAQAKHCFESALQILQQLSRQSVNPDEALSTLMLQMALGGGSGADALSDIITALLIDGLVPDLAKSFEPIVLSNLGQAYALEEDYAGAQTYLEQALQRVKANQAQNNTAELQAILPLLEPLLALLGPDLDPTLKETIRVIPELLSSLSILSNVVNLNGEAIVLNNLALVYNAQGETEEAQATFAQALAIYEDKLANYPGAVITRVNLGWLAQQAGDSVVALGHYEKAIKLLASMRSVAEGDVAQLHPSDPQTFNLVGNQGILSQQADVYALATNLYLQQGKPTEALQTLEKGRARLFFDMMSAGNTQFPDQDAELLNAVREAFDLGTQANISLTQLRAVGGVNRALISRAEEEMEIAQDLYATRLAALNAYDPKLLELAPGVEHVVDLAALQSQVLSDTTLIVYYLADGYFAASTEQLAVAWVIDADQVEAVSLDTTGAEIRAAVELLRLNLTSSSRGNGAAQQAEQLYATLMAPLEPYLRHENITIVPYGSLYYLPFAALWNGETERYLIEDYTLTYAPSLATLPLIQAQRTPNANALLVLGNPDGSLPNASAEAQTIADLYATDPLTGRLATESAVYSQSHTIDLLHLAAHGVYNLSDPLATQIALSADERNDGALEVREVFRLDLAETNLVFLSACETALGEQSMGDEITGLTRAFLYAGTPSIVTTLWNINDAASSLLVGTFYAEIAQGASFAAALQTAQLAVMHEEKWRAPYYWAAFTLHGDYLGSGEPGVIQPMSSTFTTTVAVEQSMVTATPTPEAIVQLEITVNTLNVRSGPSSAYAQIGQLRAGERVTIVGSNTGETWWQICCVAGKQGWVINNENYMRMIEKN